MGHRLVHPWIICVCFVLALRPGYVLYPPVFWLKSHYSQLIYPARRFVTH
jgi:hypothetical protein